MDNNSKRTLIDSNHWIKKNPQSYQNSRHSINQREHEKNVSSWKQRKTSETRVEEE